MNRIPAKDQIRLGVVDPNNLFRKGLVKLFVQNEPRYSNYIMVFEVADGVEMISKIVEQELPNIILMDVQMPRMDGFETVKWIRQSYPEIRVLVLSTDLKESSIVRMLRSGAHGYLSKNIDLDDLHKAITSMREKGHYLTEELAGVLLHSFSTPSIYEIERELSLRERDFLKWACTELSYQEIAGKMFVSSKTVDGYRQQLFEKFSVKSRVGLAMYAVKTGIIKI